MFQGASQCHIINRHKVGLDRYQHLVGFTILQSVNRHDTITGLMANRRQALTWIIDETPCHYIMFQLTATDYQPSAVVVVGSGVGVMVVWGASTWKLYIPRSLRSRLCNEIYSAIWIYWATLSLNKILPFQNNKEFLMITFTWVRFRPLYWWRMSINDRQFATSVAEKARSIPALP